MADDCPSGCTPTDTTGVFIDPDGHYVNAKGEHVTKDGEPSDTPVKAD